MFINPNISQKLKFTSKSKFWSKYQILVKKQILVKNQNFWAKQKKCTQNKILF